MNILIWGSFKGGHKAKKVIESKITDIDVYGFVDRNRKKRKTKPFVVVDLQQMMVLYKRGDINKIVIPSFYERNLFRDILYTVEQLDIAKEDIIVPPVEFFLTDEVLSLDEIMVPWYRAQQLDYVEFATTDCCNLNCKSCARFAPLASKKIYSHESVKKSFCELKKYIKHINMIRILGGEPFLDKNVDDYFSFLRSIYPFSEIKIVTNGLLLDKINRNIFKVMKENKIGVDISYYPPAENKIDLIKELLSDNKIDFTIESGEVFYKSFNLWVQSVFLWDSDLHPNIAVN